MLSLLLCLIACETPDAPIPEVVAPAPAAPAPEVETPAPEIVKLDVNAATEDQLATVPGAGPKMVHEFLEYRPYVSITQFRKEIGKYVDPDQVAAYEAYLYVPIDPAACDAATLAQISGLDISGAEALVAARPFASMEAFLDALGAHVTPAERVVAQAMLVFAEAP